MWNKWVKKLKKIDIGVAFALGWPILSVACSYTIGVVPQQGIENGAFCVRVCVASASVSGVRQASATANEGWHSDIINSTRDSPLTVPLHINLTLASISDRGSTFSYQLNFNLIIL